MLIDISEILKEIGGILPVDLCIDMPDRHFLGDTYHFDEPLRLTGNISNNGKSLIMHAVCRGIMTTQCARCRKDITVPLEFVIDENLVNDGSLVSRDTEAFVFSGHTIDIYEIVGADLITNLRGKYLCKDDCKGLCPNCGADLNNGGCGCSNDFIDPRWADLAQIIKNNS